MSELDIEQVWRRARAAIRGVSKHMQIAHDTYIKTSELKKELREEADSLRNALDWKLLCISYQLELLWGLKATKNEALMDLLSSDHLSIEWGEYEYDVGLIAMDSALFQLSAFIDIHLRYSLLLFGKKPEGKMRWKNYKKALLRISETSSRAADLVSYYEDRVWATDCWGHLLRELRVKIAHKNRLYPSRKGIDQDTRVALTWLTVDDRPLERLAEDFSNGVISVLQDTTPIITGNPWPS